MIIHHYISHMDNQTSQMNYELYCEIQERGKYIKNEWNGDYFIRTYYYNNKTYELCDNMELGIVSEVVEYA